MNLLYSAPGIDQPHHALYVALGTHSGQGSAVIPFGLDFEGSTIFLPFKADRILVFQMLPYGQSHKWMRRWLGTQWSERLETDPPFDVIMGAGRAEWLLEEAALGDATSLNVAMYGKDLLQNEGWGRLLADPAHGTRGGYGDQYLACYSRIERSNGRAQILPRLTGARMRIYQLLPRLFGNLNPNRKLNGTLAENGVGKFNDINDAALESLSALGISHLWLTGILRQATATDYSAIGLPADDADLLKGLAGSPYAIKDAFDLCPDYALEPAARLSEFKALLARIHGRGMRVIIDFVPNHVARSYQSTIAPEYSFGRNDQRDRFFDPQNNFFHLSGQTLALPTWRDGIALSATCQVMGSCDGRFEAELQDARVTGNNVTSASPSLSDWYETVKLNYGFDFSCGHRAYPHGAQSDIPIPDTWWKMDAVLAYWQAQGVDGFRADMAHMVPPEFWAWAIARARLRNADVVFLAEAYNNDPMKVPGGDPHLAALEEHRGNVMCDLLSAGFDAVYDDPSYKTIKSLYDASGWANDLDGALGGDYVFHNSLRYAENHDEVRLAGWGEWGGIGMTVGKPVAGLLYALSRGPVLLYHGQEVGEPAHGPTGFGGDNARTTIFDYWSLPELAKWVNGYRFDGGLLSGPQLELRAFYGRLLRLMDEPAFRNGAFFGLNSLNAANVHFGRLEGEPVSGHWLYAFLRYDRESGQRFLIAINFHRSEILRSVRIQLPAAALAFLEVEKHTATLVRERLTATAAPGMYVGGLEDGIYIGDMPALTPLYFELQFIDSKK